MIGTTLHGMRAGGEFLRTGDFEPLRRFLAASVAPRMPTAISTSKASPRRRARPARRASAASRWASRCCRAASSTSIIAGGYDPISEYVYGGFNSLRLVAEGPLRPFTRGRQGMKLAEGYAIVVLERDGGAPRRGEQAVGRRARLRRIRRCASPHAAAPARRRRRPRDRPTRCDAAGFTPSRHRPRRRPRDRHARQRRRANSPRCRACSASDLPRVPVVAFKSHLGHTLGGAGAVELILSAMAMREQSSRRARTSRPEDVEFAGLNLSTCDREARADPRDAEHVARLRRREHVRGPRSGLLPHSGRGPG